MWKMMWLDESEILTALPTPLPLKDEKENSEWTKLINYGLNNLKAIISLKDILTSNSIKLEDIETNKGNSYQFFKLGFSVLKFFQSNRIQSNFQYIVPISDIATTNSNGLKAKGKTDFYNSEDIENFSYWTVAQFRSK